MIYHIDRNHTKTLAQQKKELAKQYKNFYYLSADGKKIHFIAD